MGHDKSRWCHANSRWCHASRRWWAFVIAPARDGGRHAQDGPAWRRRSARASGKPRCHPPPRHYVPGDTPASREARAGASVARRRPTEGIPPRSSTAERVKPPLATASSPTPFGEARPLPSPRARGRGGVLSAPRRRRRYCAAPSRHVRMNVRGPALNEASKTHAYTSYQASLTPSSAGFGLVPPPREVAGGGAGLEGMARSTSNPGRRRKGCRRAAGRRMMADRGLALA